MSWRALIAIIEAEAGPEAAARIDRRARLELQGMRLTVGAREALTVADIDRVAPGRPAVAARILGVSRAAAYRAAKRPAPIR